MQNTSERRAATKDFFDWRSQCIMYCYVGIPPAKPKWLGFFCRDFILRSLEKANVTTEEITTNSAKFKYHVRMCRVTQDLERARLQIDVDYVMALNNILPLYQILFQAAEAVMTAFSEVEAILVNRRFGSC